MALKQRNSIAEECSPNKVSALCHSVEWLLYIILPGDEEGIV